MDRTAIAARNRRLALRLAAFVLFMLFAAFGAVPAYDAFCRITGFGGTTQEAASLPPADSVVERTLNISFNTNVARGLLWEFSTSTPSLQVKLGEGARAVFKVTNNSKAPITGIATYNVTPMKAGIYFQKVQCFCFEEHTLQPGETQEFPILFFVDPAFDDDLNLKDITNLTLSYTYFEAKEANKLGLENIQLQRTKN